MTPRELEEYKALRATIGARGTARVWLFVMGLMAWGGLVLATSATMSLPVATLLPLLCLAGVFEGVYALHTGVERIGRYLQVFYETGEDEPGQRHWERTAMAFGRLAPGPSPDPLFAPFFVLATAGNFVPALIAGAVPIEWAVVGALHLLCVARIVIARRRASLQRAADLERFETLKRT